MAEDVGSTVPRRQLGRELRELRTEALITLDGAAEALRWSRQKMWRIESGAGAVRELDVRLMCELYGARRPLADALTALAGETRVKGWWHSYGDSIPRWYDLYAGLEAAASRLREHATALVPTLLQTRGYATEVCQHRVAGTGDERDCLVEARLRRQDLLSRRLPPPSRLDVMLSEAVLLRAVGGPATMAEQLRHLLTVGRLPHVTIRVASLAAGLHVGAIAGAFVLLDFPPGSRIESEPPVVYRESLTGALYLDRPAELAAYEKIWASLDTLALDEEQSRRLITKIIEEVHQAEWVSRASR
ncbi:Helix-turn-helix domain-containing protein [Micromonospora matsumotoense]|uniref:Helix-turn-helix domain-containing protein n=1 Tax=Micromonospora matsumotoense TaxID=121616 RepID=A0A1C4VUJ4_9ACTN|nr:helix-turn-helix transcriptional regulator [Micromonospora matsumotoense]SCE87694.1 Helix-turn-helix domain-containing protein [Micromonospora matsumotoense]